MKIKRIILELLVLISISAFAACESSNGEKTTFNSQLLSTRFVEVSQRPDGSTVNEMCGDTYIILCDKETRILYLAYFETSYEEITALTPLLGDDGLPQKYKGSFAG